MRDLDIRKALHATELAPFHNDGESVVVDELGLCQGGARVDIAVVNGALHGYEIKSERDTLERLPGQVEVYGRTLDTVDLVTSGSHLTRARAVIPPWWGIIQAVMVGGEVRLRRVRKARRNPSPDPFSVAQLLWRDEVLAILEDLGIADGLRSKPRRTLWQALAGAVSREELNHLVRDRLKARGNWRSAELRA